MSEVKLPEGYKQTEVGVIPEDWEVKDIGEALTIKHGMTPAVKSVQLNLGDLNQAA